MKILELTPSLAPGGAERFTVDFTNELSKENDVTLLVMRQFEKSDFYRKELSEKVHCIQGKGTLTLVSKFFQVFYALFWILKLKPDVVHAHTVGINWLLLPSILHSSCKYYFTIHNLANQECTTRMGYRIRKFLFKRNVRAVTISEICEKSFVKFFGFHSFAMIPNGCRNIHTTKRLDDVKVEIERLKKSSQTKVFVNVARLMHQKNHKLLIQAFNFLAKENYDVVLLQIGNYKDYPHYKEELDALITTDRIHFLGTRTNVADYLALADYFCLSSAWEGLPISLLEAGLMGCYPISTPAGGCVDVIINKQWGLLSKDFELKSYIESLKEALNTDYNRDCVTKLYQEKYLMSFCVKKYIELFES